jgi:hypothetical protein
VKRWSHVARQASPVIQWQVSGPEFRLLNVAKWPKPFLPRTMAIDSKRSLVSGHLPLRSGLLPRSPRMGRGPLDILAPQRKRSDAALTDDPYAQVLLGRQT